MSDSLRNISKSDIDTAIVQWHNQHIIHDLELNQNKAILKANKEILKSSISSTKLEILSNSVHVWPNIQPGILKDFLIKKKFVIIWVMRKRVRVETNY